MKTKPHLKYIRGCTSPRILIVGEAWGAEEASARQPFVGAAGRELIRMLVDSGLCTTSSNEAAMIDRAGIMFANVINAKPPGNHFEAFLHRKDEGRGEFRGLHASDALKEAHEGLMELVEQVRPEVVVPAGNYALWALTPHATINRLGPYYTPTGILKWRGSQVYTDGGVPCVPIVHPAAILRQWELRYPTVHDLRVRVGRVSGPKWEVPEWVMVVEPDFPTAKVELESILNHLDASPRDLSVDIETSRGHLVCIGLSVDGRRAICIPYSCASRPGQYWTLDEETEVSRLLRLILLHPNAQIIGQNFSYDTQYIVDQLLVRPRCAFDTMLAHHLLYPGTPKGLDYLSSLYCSYHRYWKDDGKEFGVRIDDRENWTYNCEDVLRTFEVKQTLADVISTVGKEDLLQERMDLHELSLDMMFRGVRVDTKVRNEFALTLMEDMARREVLLNEYVPDWLHERKKGAKPWYRSPQQLATLFYDTLGIKPIINRSTGSRTVSDEALDTIMLRQPLVRPICRLIKEYRSLGVYLSTFVRASLDADDRMRCSFNVSGTETFRWSSSKNAFGRGANLQNIPKGTEE